MPAPGTLPPPNGDDWTAISDAALPVGDAYAWAIRPDCGAVVVFTGTARDHSDGRPDVSELAYEAYEEQAVPRMQQVVRELRDRWPEVGRVAIVHRVGDVPIGQEAVLVVVSAPHRQEAFAAARFGIDAVKAAVPVWKRERWDGGEGWGLEAQHLVDPSAVPAVAAPEAVLDAGARR
ncbi:molybdenum cofactor biosynthesis protein MoaE [Dermatobacter hominis]|uniref:molybdenum cofactor biosynthesis protein MoaE n=1 Tax=Dermatobacter hominis TaxID=2884263 RepID=UPI001D106912|nr:molybdenum cofactor biosynthesis protein MoaE [Dermatobacter hominis]UDY34860.1 molybdenum cofactor biosynthesis protein MoaE [Dermatobacter hominis]